jgi:hypothetical protein
MGEDKPSKDVVDDINDGNEDRTDDKKPFTAFSSGITTAGEC